MLRPLLLALLLFAAAPLGAQTYKWVDENGVVNYSNAPPPGAAAARPVPVAERVSTIAADPSLDRQRAALQAREARREELAEAEWLQRQRLMAAHEDLLAVAQACPERTDCDSPHGAVYPYYPLLYVPRFTAVSFRRPLVAAGLPGAPVRFHGAGLRAGHRTR